ncbi:hypothetical protein [Microcoleus sp. bin38.metabat.b11b12b14.051]|uniref:hypothetical protein n=1 Tax=Microcoleus sp. bin38.metabat.b11b12b14.051 TaxID=2742709 RepID=UPI0025E13EA6|nr:hypothetical protein [Microcoleus sp. bin38.metabat.b11b12b14.051]
MAAPIPKFPCGDLAISIPIPDRGVLGFSKSSPLPKSMPPLVGARLEIPDTPPISVSNEVISVISLGSSKSSSGFSAEEVPQPAFAPIVV